MKEIKWAKDQRHQSGVDEGCLIICYITFNKKDTSSESHLKDIVGSCLSLKVELHPF